MCAVPRRGLCAFARGSIQKYVHPLICDGQKQNYNATLQPTTPQSANANIQRENALTNHCRNSINILQSRLLAIVKSANICSTSVSPVRSRYAERQLVTLSYRQSWGSTLSHRTNTRKHKTQCIRTRFARQCVNFVAHSTHTSGGSQQRGAGTSQFVYHNLHWLIFKAYFMCACAGVFVSVGNLTFKPRS